MGFYTTTLESKTASRKTPSCSSKTASRKFFSYPIKTSCENRSNSLKTSQKNPIYNHRIASGRSSWPSRDPIEESGGVNVYQFCYNNSIYFWDARGQEPNSGGSNNLKLPINPKTGLIYKRYLFLGSDQAVARKKYADGNPVDPEIIKEEEALIKKLKSLAKSKGFKVSNARIAPMQAVWSHKDVTHVITHTHGEKNGKMVCTKKLTTGVFKGQYADNYVAANNLFAPKKGKGKSLLLACCHPYANVFAHSKVYAQSGVSLQTITYRNEWNKVITKGKDQKVSRESNRYEIIKYLKSLK